MGGRPCGGLARHEPARHPGRRFSAAAAGGAIVDRHALLDAAARQHPIARAMALQRAGPYAAPAAGLFCAPPPRRCDVALRLHRQYPAGVDGYFCRGRTRRLDGAAVARPDAALQPAAHGPGRALGAALRGGALGLVRAAAQCHGRAPGAFGDGGQPPARNGAWHACDPALLAPRRAHGGLAIADGGRCQCQPAHPEAGNPLPPGSQNPVGRLCAAAAVDGRARRHLRPTDGRHAAGVSGLPQPVRQPRHRSGQQVVRHPHARPGCTTPGRYRADPGRAPQQRQADGAARRPAGDRDCGFEFSLRRRGA